MKTLTFANQYYFYFSFTGFYGKAYSGLTANDRNTVR